MSNPTKLSPIFDWYTHYKERRLQRQQADQDAETVLNIAVVASSVASLTTQVEALTTRVTNVEQTVNNLPGLDP